MDCLNRKHPAKAFQGVNRRQSSCGGRSAMCLNCFGYDIEIKMRPAAEPVGHLTPALA
jgi:hypothetical protein